MLYRDYTGITFPYTYGLYRGTYHPPSGRCHCCGYQGAILGGHGVPSGGLAEPLLVSGWPLGSLNIFPYWCYREPSILIFFTGL